MYTVIMTRLCNCYRDERAFFLKIGLGEVRSYIAQGPQKEEVHPYGSMRPWSTLWNSRLGVPSLFNNYGSLG